MPNITGTETVIKKNELKMQKPIESIVHFGKSFTQPIPSITNLHKWNRRKNGD